jgi:hypothetical protein
MDPMTDIDALRQAMAELVDLVAEALRPIVEAVAAWFARWWPMLARALKTARRFHAFQHRRPTRPWWRALARRSG